MYKLLTIGGKEYKLEYTIEASLYKDCISDMVSLLAEIQDAASKEDFRKTIREMANVPQVAWTIFYAGLMEAHGNHPNGDKTVPDKETAKQLLVQYIQEHKGQEEGNFYGVMNMCVEQMGEDGFFELTGMDSMITKGTELMTKMNRQQRRAAKKNSGK